MTQSPNPQSPIHGNQQTISGQVQTAVGGNVGQIGDIHNNFITQAAERPPLWVQVPGRPARFLGREPLMDNLVARLLADGAPAVAVYGLPGVGKSSVAVMLAHHKRLLAHFSDGILWAGLGLTPDLPSLLLRWATALEIDISQLRTDGEKAQALRDAIGHRRLLLVIDDAWQIDPARILRCGGPNCAYLLTSRDRGLARAFAGADQSVEIPVLAEDPAHTLLRGLAPEAWQANPAAAAHLADSVNGLPLALELLGGYLADPQNSTFAELIDASLAEMADPARRLALASIRLGDGSGTPVTLQATIALSLEALPEAVQSLFYALGAFAPQPARFDSAAAQAVAVATPVAGADLRSLALLAARHLLEVAPDESLSLHQTLADVARTRTPAEAVTRHREHYLERVNADREDWQAIEAVYPQIQHAWQQTISTDPVAVEFVDTLETYQTRRGLWNDRLDWLAVAVETAESNGDSKSQARMLNEFGVVYDALGEKEKALGYYEEALPLRRQVGGRSGEATTLNNIGAVYRSLGEMEKALGYYAEALPLFRQVGDRSGEAATLNNIGAVYRSLGEMEKALEYYEETLPLSHQVGDRSGEATTLNNIGIVYSALGEKEKALGYYAEALPLIRQVGDRSGEAATLNNIGAVYRSLGEMEKALGCYAEALLLFRQVGDRSGEATTLSNIGAVYDGLGEKGKALGYFEEALPLSHQVGDRSGEATTLNYIGLVYDALGEKEKALGYYAEALPLIRQAGDRSGEAATLNNIGLVYDALGEKEKALGYYEEALPLRRQVGDRFGESVTRFNLAMVFVDLDRLAEAEEQLEIVVQIDEAVRHPDLESDRRELERVRTMRRAAQ